MVAFKELAGSPVETYEPEGLKVERRLLCAYEDRYAVVAALLGSGEEFGGRAPAGYADANGVLAMRVRLEPFQKRPDDQGAFEDLAEDVNRYRGQLVEVVVIYEVLAPGSHCELPSVAAGTLLSYRMDFGGEYVTLPGQSLHWQSDSSLPVTPDAVPTVRVPITEHHVIWHRVLSPPWEAIRACVGCVNAGDFLGAAAETLLCDGAKADRQFAGLDESGQPQFGWRMTYIFREKAVKILGDDAAVYGWNHSYRALPPASGAWDRLVDADGNALYGVADFHTLFQFAME
jgi:hypothetical protein